jgi:predicted RNase H-like HicB family nuclease
MTIDELMALPWTWQGPALVQDEGEAPYYELRVAELPDFFVIGQTAEEARAESSPALRAFLSSYVEVGEEPTLPKRAGIWIWFSEKATLLTGAQVPQPRGPVVPTQVLKEFQAA